MADNDPEKRDGNEIYPYPGSPRSSVWKCFGFKKRKEGLPTKQNLNMEEVICKLCKKSYANKGNTTNLQNHLDKHHRNQVDLPLGPSQPKREKHVQPTINQQLMHTVGKVPLQKKQKLDDLVLKLIVGKVLPISLVESSFFKVFVKELDPRYEPPSKYDVIKSLMEKKREMTVKLKNDLPPVGGYIAMTHDGWTSCATQSYDTVTAHFISKDWELRTAILHTTKVEGSHTGEHIAERLKETVSEWSIPVPTVVTDNAANEKKALELLGWTRFGCYGHRLNLAVKHALEIPEVSRLLGKCRKMVTLFHQSTSLNDCLIEKQTLVYSDTPTIIGHKLKNDVPTRWNSSLEMLRRLSEQMAAILAIASDDKLNINKSTCNNLRSYCLTFDEMNLAEGFIKLLSPFEKATTILCAENSPTMNKVLISMAKTNKILELESQSDSAVIRKVVSKLQEQLAMRTQAEEIPVMAALLNPDTKSLSFLPVHEQVAGHRLLLDKALALVDENGNLQVKVKREPDSEVPSTSSVPELPKLPENIDIVVETKDETVVQEVSVSEYEPVTKKIKLSDMDE